MGYGQTTAKRRSTTYVLAALSGLFTGGIAWGQTVVIPQGLPVQIKPTYTEPGLPAFDFSGGSSLDGGSGGGNGGGGDDDGGSGGADAGGAALDTMNAQSWGAQASTAASAMGVNASALAATCVMESGCKNSGAGSGSSASGVWQMIDSTYNADIAGAIALNPSIASNITAGLDGKMDPATQAYAAAYELRQDALILQKNGISNPTVLDTRTLYQFGQQGGLAVAQASDSDNLSSLLTLTPSQLATNGISSNTTVGQWRQTITSKLGLSASQVVLAQK
ncbi:hypothetical protein M2322_004458 [Rhodoblastus acidophilus]|uniref:hypothetical protein n=1 Tax=Rhodoblastus acidophilus TaxID=1074 RepID=UPI00222492A0|nr:hypothetical protein [Rhodoblastus acidophilus]MCW2318889.1 hypothetical protein [Rhodoblastus acidophilus]